MENIYSPVSGKTVELSKVPDEMFATKMLGDGMALLPEDEHVYAPANGTITLIYPTKHAIGITTDQGSELLIHIGLDTFDLKGEPFTMQVTVGEHVDQGDPLVKVALGRIKSAGYETITPVISCNKPISKLTTQQYIKAGEILFQIID